MSISVLDPTLGLPIPSDLEVVLSDRDRVADTLATAQETGVLPVYEECQEIERQLRSVGSIRGGQPAST